MRLNRQPSSGIVIDPGAALVVDPVVWSPGSGVDPVLEPLPEPVLKIALLPDAVLRLPKGLLLQSVVPVAEWVPEYSALVLVWLEVEF